MVENDSENTTSANDEEDKILVKTVSSILKDLNVIDAGVEMASEISYRSDMENTRINVHNEINQPERSKAIGIGKN
jgi:hypothetical protein